VEVSKADESSLTTKEAKPPSEAGIDDDDVIGTENGCFDGFFVG
jgi:hypothetical protein